jgi:Spy/CpxP family protein refolding chaperone
MKTNKSNLRNLVTVVLAATALTAGAAIAQPGPGAGHGQGLGPAVRVLRGALASLDLTQEQKDKVKVVLDAEKPAMQAMGAQHKADAKALNDLAATAQPDPKAVGEAFLKVQQNRVAGKAARESVLAKVEAILTPAQKAKFQGYIQAAKDAGKAKMGRRAGGAGFQG